MNLVMKKFRVTGKYGNLVICDIFVGWSAEVAIAKFRAVYGDNGRIVAKQKYLD